MVKDKEQMTKEIEYQIVVHYEGTKTFDVYAQDFEQALEIARRGPEHTTNAHNDTITETIIRIERLDKDQ